MTIHDVVCVALSCHAIRHRPLSIDGRYRFTTKNEHSMNNNDIQKAAKAIIQMRPTPKQTRHCASQSAIQVKKRFDDMLFAKEIQKIQTEI